LTFLTSFFFPFIKTQQFLTELDESHKHSEARKPWKDIWSAGHGVMNINDIPTVHDLVNTLKLQYKKSLSNL